MAKHGRLLLPGDALMDPRRIGSPPPDSQADLRVGRVELSRQMTHRDQPPVPGSRLGGLEQRMADLERTLTNRIRLLEDSNTALSLKVQRLARKKKRRT